MVARWGVDLPHWDQWELVPLLEKDRAGDVTLADLAAQHNEHRLLFPRLLMLSLARVSHWNVRWELMTHVLLAAAIFAAAASMALKVERGGWLPPALSLLVFSPAQWENWAWGWQSQVFLAVAGSLGAVAILARFGGRWTGTLGAALPAFVATFSYANGLLIWVLALPLVARRAEGRWVRVGLWMTAAAATLALFFAGYRSPQSLPDAGLLDPHRLKLFGGYVSLYLGSPVFGFHGQLALYGGFLAVVGFAALVVFGLRREPGRFADLLPWLTVASVAVASAVLTASGRLDEGLHQALTPRYMTFANLFWIGLLGCLAVLRPWSDPPPSAPSRRKMAVAAALLVALAWGANAVHGWNVFRAQHGERSPVRQALIDGEDVDLTRLYPDESVVAQRLETLRALRYSLFRGP